MRRVHEVRYLRFYYYRLVDTSAGGLLLLDSIIRPVASVSALTCIYDLPLWYLQTHPTTYIGH